MAQAGGQAGVGRKPNVAGLLCYAFFWVGGLALLPVEKDRFVRFHAIQSIIFFGAVSVAYLIIFWIPFVGWIIGWIIWAFAIIMWIVLMVKAYQGNKFKLPIAGDIAEKNA